MAGATQERLFLCLITLKPRVESCEHLCVLTSIPPRNTLRFCEPWNPEYLSLDQSPVYAMLGMVHVPKTSSKP
jgi:hypothetical protein